MKIEILKKGEEQISPIAHSNSVYCPDGINLTSHLDKLEDAVMPNGYVKHYVDVDYSASPYYVNAVPRLVVQNSKWFGTAPIAVKAGETIIFECSVPSGLTALTKVDGLVEPASTISALTVESVGDGDFKTYTYTASEDMYVKISCSEDYGLTVKILKDVKVADNAIDYLEQKIDDTSRANYVKNAGEVLPYQEIGSTDYAVIMMYGQSLSIGQESAASFVDDDVEGCYMLDGGVHSTSGSKLLPLNTGLPRTSDIASGRQDPVVSATKAFVNLYHKAHPEDKNTKFIAVSLGVGGKSLVLFADEDRYSWVNTSYMSSRVIPCLTALKEIADAEGKTISLCSLIWCQGETDYGTAYVGKSYADWFDEQPNNFGGSLDAYKQGLHNLYDDIFANAQEIFGADNQVAPPPFFAYALGGKWITNAFLTINHATYELADELDAMWIVAPNYPVPDYNGGHLAMNGYRWYGEYIAKAMYYALIKKVDWKPLRPTSVEIVNGNVEVTFDRPVTLDTYTNDECPDYGFVLRQGTAAQLNTNKAAASSACNVGITSVTLSQDGKKITIVPTAALTAACVEVIYAGKCGTYSSDHFQGSGNVRDFDGWKSLYTYRDDAGDHGNPTNSDYWKREVAGASDTQPMWDSESTYDYGDVVRYTQGSTTYKCTSLMSNNTEAPFKSGGAPNVGVAWQETTYDGTAPDFSESVLNSDGYAYGATVNITEISSVFGKRTIKSLRGGDTNGNKVYPYTKVDYKPEDANGNSIVGSKYPMQNWCINFYVRLDNE